MKTLVYQVNIGHGTQWGINNLTLDFINKVCIPSVLNYAKKNNYDYKIFDQDIFSNYGKNFLNSKGTSLSYNKYLYLGHGDYDQYIYVDTDIYIFDNAEKLPEVKTFYGVPEPEVVDTHDIFRNYYSLDGQFKYINSGFFMCNLNTANFIYRYFTNRIKEQRKGKVKNTDNGILNEFLYIDNENFKFEVLDEKWNFMPHLKKNICNTKPNFMHFVGGPGKEYIRDLNKQTNDIKMFLEDVFWNNN